MILQELKIIIVDDDLIETDHLQNELQKAGGKVVFRTEVFRTAESFLERIPKSPKPDIVLLDVHLGSKNGISGVELAKECRERLPSTLIVMLSGDMRAVAKSLASGADDFIDKNSKEGELALRLAISYQSKFGNLQTQKTDLSEPKDNLPIVGSTMDAIARRIPRIIKSAIRSVHVFGESGTGKEIVAEIFKNHLPAGMPFQKVNCGAIQSSLLESELFGHVKGAFTGATSDKVGLLASASGGWIYLDEVANLTQSAQAALLRAIENQEIIRVGDNKIRKIDVKILSATNASLPEMVAKGEFRGDLWQRLCEADIHLPPLRERPAEIKELAIYFANTSEGGPYQISKPALEIICGASWKSGNVRELRNCIRAMTENSVDGLLTPLGIPKRILEEEQEFADSPDELSLLKVIKPENAGENCLKITWPGEDIPPYSDLADMVLVEALKFAANRYGLLSFRQSARLLNMSRITLNRRLQEMVNSGRYNRSELVRYIRLAD